MKTTINVTQEHIENGEAENCNYCPIALAVREVILPDTPIEVTWRGVEFVFEDFTAELPSNACEFIEDFDDGELEVYPFSFDLDIPDELLAEKSK